MILTNEADLVVLSDAPSSVPLFDEPEIKAPGKGQLSYLGHWYFTF